MFLRAALVRPGEQVLSLRKEKASMAHAAEQEIEALQAKLREVTKVKEAEGKALRMENDELAERASRAEERASGLETDMENLRFEVDFEREERDRAMLVLEDAIKAAQVGNPPLPASSRCWRKGTSIPGLH